MSIAKFTDEEYFALDALNNSTLSRLAKCPAAMKVEVSQTPQMALGSAAHCLILEGADAFKERFYVMEKVDLRTKEGREYKKQVECEAVGKTIVTTEDLSAISSMAESVFNHPFARQLIADGQPEMAVTWEKEGVKCKAKVDYLSKHLIDLKTTQDATEYTFQRTIINSRYHNQMAWYYDGLRANLRNVEGVFIIAVENRAPFTTSVFQFSDEMLEWGRASYMPLLRKYKECLANNQFPSYQYAGAIEVNPPAWVSL